ncbi:hypothetical protein, partial [Limosilactobacillus fermentum]|uniref:hypothetical protein n=1 Tax=Limosilactobacillus fermentum TaxID=1613 RepID=UPI0019643807
TLRIPLFQAKEMTLPQQNTDSARPTSFYYLMCQLDRVQYLFFNPVVNGHRQKPLDVNSMKPSQGYNLNNPIIHKKEKIDDGPDF